MLLRIFLAALAIRWGYASVLFASMGVSGLIGNDSLGYLAGADIFAKAIAAGAVHGAEWFGPQGYAMPLFQWVIALCALAFGTHAPFAYVLLQGLLDACTCILIYRIAFEIDPRFAAPAGVVATLNPTQIVLSALVYTDTLFLFFVAVFLLATVKWLQRPTVVSAVMIAVALGAATLTRALAGPFAPFLLLFLVAAAILARRPRGQFVRQLVASAVIYTLCIAPVIYRNVASFGVWSLTPQGGQHLALWVAPLVKEAKDGTPWQQTYNQNQKLTEQRFPSPAANLFELSNRYTEIGREQLAQLGPGAILKAWVNGAAINLAAPAIILSPPISQLPRTGFYETPGATPFQKITNFLFHSDNAVYSWILIVGVAGVVLVRLIQLSGVVLMLQNRTHWPVLCLFGLWIVYILAVDGPVASPKYRLPLEVPFCVLTGAGLCVFRRQAT
jgi:hypothetical protein